MDVGGNGASEAVISKRRREAVELLKNAKEGHFGAYTLRELTQLLDHECYCLEQPPVVVVRVRIHNSESRLL